MAPADAAIAHALGARRAHERARALGQGAGAGVAEELRRSRRREHERGEDEVPQAFEQRVAPPDIRRPAGGKEVRVHGEEQDREDAEPEDGDGDRA